MVSLLLIGYMDLLRFLLIDYKAPNFHVIFSSVILYDILQDENQLATFKKQLEEDKKIVTSRSNLSILRKVILWFLKHLLLPDS